MLEAKSEETNKSEAKRSFFIEVPLKKFATV
jgi:hypothetical protein